MHFSSFFWNIKIYMNRLVRYFIGVTEIRVPPISNGLSEDQSSYSIVREPQKCIVCNRCVRKCS
ncbi:hypothetical protein, partial [Petrotoga sp. SL27]|uniref:hypothetical protein n=1 Tax=Petrotoga sp. SL27 TaxID=1445612 RepID=UPI001E36E589